MSATHQSRQSGPSTGLADALFPGTRRKLLDLLFGQPGRAYSISELIELAGAGFGAVQREVQRLSASGLLTVEVTGRQKLYRANPDAPIYEELCTLVAKTMGPAQHIREALDAADDAVELALVYGSVADGSDRADSDIDLLLVSDTLSLEDVFRLVASAERELGRTISPTVYTSEEFHGRVREGNPFLKRILAGKHVKLKGDNDGPFTSG